MKRFFDKTRLAVSGTAASLAIVMTMIAPRASAQDARTEALERSLQQLEASMQIIRNELSQLKSDSAREAQKLMKIEEMSTSMEKRQTLEAQNVTKIEEVAASVEKRQNSRHYYAPLILTFHQEEEP